VSGGLPGIRLDPVNLRQAVDRCTEAVDRGECLRIGMVNAAKVVAMSKNEALRQAVCGCDLVLADGQAVVWASRLLGRLLPERVTGIDLFTELLAQAAARGDRVYFLGARAEVGQAMLAEVRRRHRDLVIAGYRDGYFGPEQDGEVADAIKQTSPDLLFIGISSPRKEMFVQNFGELTGAKVVHGVGGSFDILAGITRRAPAWWQRHGLEWLYRALQEPVRLGRRYASTNLAFLTLVARAALRRPDPGEIGHE
jgi:N-acetylglucosaminyldiphosphoundecaprenol N-acetyl-beta-D-mannosaminyltransferase